MSTTPQVFRTTETTYANRNGAECAVLRPLTDAESDLGEVGPMYRVRFTDGAEIDAFADELIPAAEGR